MSRSARKSAFINRHRRDTYLKHYENMMRTWPDHDTVAIGGSYGRTAVTTTGSPGSPPLVLLHGRYTPTPTWAPIIDELARHFHVHAVDTIGEPGNSLHDGAALRSAGDYMRWLEEVFDGLGLDAAHIGGHSFGGWLAARFALKNPHRTRSLTLLDPAQVFAPFTVRWLVACIRPYLFPSRANVERLMRQLGENRPHHDDLVELAVLGMTGFRLRAPEATLVSKRALAGLRVPTQQLIAAGSIVHRPARAARRAAATAPEVTSRLVRDASHFLFHDRAAVVANAFRSLA